MSEHYFCQNGYQLAYRKQGEGPLMLILPGNTASSALHQEELDYFGARYCAVSMDFHGTGKSDRMARWSTDWWEDNAHDAAALLDHLDVEDCVAVGTSGGANVALLLAVLYPQRVRVVVADSTVAQWDPLMLGNTVKMRQKPLEETVQFWKTAHGEDWRKVVDADGDMLMRFVHEKGGNVLGGRLKRISCPVLFTASLADSALPDPGGQNLAMAAQVADSHVYISSQGGHPLMWSRKAVWRNVVDCFLQ